MYLKNLLLGIILGIGFIIPGVSGGVIATILGIYDTIIYKLNHFFKDFKKNILYFGPLVAGVFISIIFFSKLILYLLNNKHFLFFQIIHLNKYNSHTLLHLQLLLLLLILDYN